jgi:hypothetical protein
MILATATRDQTKEHSTGKNARRVLLINPADLPDVALALRDVLASSETLFDRGVPVYIARSADGGLPVAVPLTTHGVVRITHQHCRPVALTKTGTKPTTLPDRIAGLYLDMLGDWHLPKLVGITNAPLLTEDGGARVAEGYDRHAGLYCSNVPELVLPERPTKQQALTAVTTLRHTFRTFPFADAVRISDPTLGVDVVDLGRPIGMDESGFLVGLLTAVCRQSLWLAPGFLLNAPQISGAGSGKGLLARAISAIAYGLRPRPFTPGNDRHEMDKRIVAELIEGGPVLFMDNVNATLLRSNTLASIITERPCGVRELGRSRMVKLEHSTFVVLTGNGLSVSEDLARRFIFSQLDPQVEDPEARPFRPGFLEQIEHRRAELLGAALTVWRWGRQNAHHLKPGITLGSFETWGTWVRDPLLALGCQDPVAQIKEIKAKDPKRQKVAEIYELWWANHAATPTRASELAEEVKAAIDPQDRGRQFITRAVEDLTGTRQSGFVLTRQKGEGRKAVATYALKQTTDSDGAKTHTGHTPHTQTEPESSTEPTLRTDRGNGDAQGMPEAPAALTQGMSAVADSESTTNTTPWDELAGMRGMRGIPSAVNAVEKLGPNGAARCAQCGLPADDQPIHEVGDGWRTAMLHRRCEIAWLHAAPVAGSTSGGAHSGTLSSSH